MTIARDLSLSTLDKITSRFNLREDLAADGGPILPLPGPMPGAGGVMRVWSGDGIVERVVYVGIAFPPASLDSHMIFAFGRSDNGVPHFTLDAISAPGTYAFHLDLIPRIDLGANLAYMDAIYGPLTETYTSGLELEGRSEAPLSPRQHALMSPWMLAGRADEPAFLAMGDHVDAYLDRWTKLAENGLPVDLAADITGEQFAARDAGNRDALFNADVDPVWHQITPIIGEDHANKIISALKGESI